MSRWLLFPLVLLWGNLLPGQSDPVRLTLRETVEPAPASRVIDYGDIFAYEPQAYDNLSQSLQDLYAKHGFSVYLVAYSGIIGGSVGERARLFRDHWLEPGRDGLVIVCDTDLKQVGFGIAQPLPPKPHREPTRFQLADHELERLIRELQDEIGNVESESAFLQQFGDLLVSKINTALEENHHPPRGLPRFIIPLLLFAALLVTALTWLGSWLKHKRGPGNSPNRRFPDIDVHPRLGADYGGGTVSELSFRPPP